MCSDDVFITLIGKSYGKVVTVMKKLLIIKTGGTFPIIKGQFGDFEEMIRTAVDLKSEEVVVAPVYKGIEVLPALENIGAIIITGSHSMVTDREEWSEQLKVWLQQIVHFQIPTLGICYGHQILAEAFGGKVDDHPKGIEIGTTTISFTEAGREDTLIGCLSPVLYRSIKGSNQGINEIISGIVGHVTHSQTVVKLPKQAVVLANNDFEQHHAFKLNHMYGVQFHQEFTADIIHAYIDEQRAQLEARGLCVDMIHKTVVDNEYGKQLLQQFILHAGLKKEIPKVPSSASNGIFTIHE